MSSLDSQALSRKERLAQLRNLKRKREGEEQKVDGEEDTVVRGDEKDGGEVGDTASILSRRNYDPEARAPKQGFFEPPTMTEPTVEEEAKRIEREGLGEHSSEEKPEANSDDNNNSEGEEGEESTAAQSELDVSSLRPRAANWDIKRQIASKLEILQRQTDVAINRIVRERVRSASPGASAIPAGVDLNKAMDKIEAGSAQ
ncbi:mRNA splicing factor [Myxozyma melibiosi]|uniref:mRNA splicing factor n=1 Tax=Myxozyma melibiosi TaxID=54550 RepID=A0ABR1F1V7_9ASCO